MISITTTERNAVFPIIEVPANASRYFSSPSEAIQQPVANLAIKFHEDNKYFYNHLFDSSLIHYDNFYYTRDNFQIVNSVNIFYKLIKKFDLKNIVDIGCGQGEFVNRLNDLNINAFGFDPALKTPSSNLRNEYFDPEKIQGMNQNTFVMRCVLPHIVNPWEFINQILSRSKKALIYVEFQNLEWILSNKSWNSLSHDHVNLFTLSDFESRYKIVDSGNFSKGEWTFVLFKSGEQNYSKLQRILDSKKVNKFNELFEYRKMQLNLLVNLKKEVLIYGAAGKGIVFSHAYKSHGGGGLFCIDSDIGRQGKYLECSGVEVISPNFALENFDPKTLKIVMNQNHTQSVKEIFANKSSVFSISEFSVY
jgi:hypothetical protein